MPGAQTLGWIMFFLGEHNRNRENGVLGLHEGEHVEQALRWGIFRDITYGAEWCFRVVVMPGAVPAERLTIEFWTRRNYSQESAKKKVKKWGSRWWRAYWNLYWERAARKAAGQQVK
jgi:hypothetical protein